MQFDRRAAEREIAARHAAYQPMPMQVYAGGRRSELSALMRGYKADQVTPREFSARMRRVMVTL